MPLKQNKNIKEVGHIFSLFSGVAKIKGLPHVFLHEVLLDSQGKEVAIVFGFDEQFVEALFFSDNFNPDNPIYRSEKIFSIEISDNFLGRIVNGFSMPLDGLPKIRGKSFSVFNQAPGIIDRDEISTPLSTGIKVIDSTLPLGRGQRQLIIGDRKLGKSTIAIDTILNQKEADTPVYCIYVLCGQKKSQLQRMINLFTKNNTFLYTTIVAATAGDSFAAQYLAPFVGCAIGEYFRDQGKDALIVYDDLTKHAKNYRNLSLLLERSPSREAYPGDIFSIHAGLLERAAKLSKNKKGGSLTALPIIETLEGDITGFIPTNLISITDGQIYLERGLYQKAFLPAVNVGLSVSRVGSKAQPLALKEVTSGLRLVLAQYKELQKLTQLETVISEEAQKNIHRGELMLELLKQPKHTNVSWSEQVILFYLVENGFFDNIKKQEWSSFEKLLLNLIISRYQNIIQQIKNGKFNKKVKTEIQEIILDFKQEFLVK